MNCPTTSNNPDYLLRMAGDACFDLSLDPLLLLDGAGRLVRANGAARREFLLPEESPALPVTELFARYPRIREEIADFDSANDCVVQDGRGRSWRVVKSLLGPEVSRLGLLVTLREVTESVRDEELRERAERWQALEQAGVATVYKNHETGMVHFSDGLKRMLGYAADEIDSLQTVDAWHGMLHPHELEQILSTFQADGKEEVSYTHVVHRLCCKDGGWKWIHALGAVIRRDADGRPLRGAGVVTDITSLREVCRTTGVSFDSPEDAVRTTCDTWRLQEIPLQVVTPGGAILRLNSRESQFFGMLADAAPVILPRMDAITGIYGRFDESSAHAFDVLISRLRKKVEMLTSAPFPLQTLYGLGYLFAARLTRR